MKSDVTIYTGKKIITMNPVRPEATAVAVRENRILGVGTLDELKGWGDYTVDETFNSKIIIPGLIEAHCHAFEGKLWMFPYIGYFDRYGPDGTLWRACKSFDAVIEKLKEIDAEMTDADEPLIAWGMDPIYFEGDRLVASHLDRVSKTRPIYVLHTSGHLATVNTALMKKQDIDEDARLVKEDRRARAKVRLAKITTRKKEEARQREMQRQKAEIRVIIDEINRTSEEEIFDDEVKESIAEKVSTWGLAKERSVLVVGHSGNDYLPILLTKLGLRVSVIDLNKREVEEQNRLHRQFGLDKQIESFDSYEALGDRKYDYITALAVINDAINTLETDRLQQLAAISATATGEQREGLENVARSVFEPKVKEFIRPILLHLNPDNGYFLVNKPGVISTKINRQFPDLVVFVDKLLVYLDNVLPSLGDELGISFTPQPHIDVGNFTMHPSWFSELRVGAAYQCGNTSPLTLESLPPVMPPSITNIQNRLERCANEWPA